MWKNTSPVPESEKVCVYGFAQPTDKLEFAEVKINVIPEIAEWRVKMHEKGHCQKYDLFFP